MSKLISLNGTWKMRWTDHQRGDKTGRLLTADAPTLDRAIPARVPGEVHLDLIRAGLITEPAVQLGFLACRWVEECLWHFHHVFRAPRLRPGEKAWLVFDTLDLAAVIHLNGTEIGRHANAFRPCRIEVTDSLQAGQNTLLVTLEAGLYHAADKPVSGLAGVENTLSRRHWLRTTQSTFGWDWSNRLGNVGIRGNVSLEIAAAVRAEPLVAIATLTDDLHTGHITVRLPVEGLADRPQNAVWSLAIPGTAVRTRVPVVIQPGANRLEAVLTVPDPALWWPVGHGDQPLYTVRSALRLDGRLAASGSRRIGFRHVRICQDPHPVKGRYFLIEINRKPIFMKGGNAVPADPILARLDQARYETLVDRALEAGFNLLRIWGGGLYESDALYDMCDEKGVLLWQEFIFACSRYPGHDEGFAREVKLEAAHQVRRLAHHPALVLWCGNNEIEQGYWQWGYDRQTALPCHSLFHHVLPRIVKEEDGSRFYLPSSPFSPDHESPTADHVGDQHPWSVGFANTDFRDYRRMICRFPNEGGILGPTALPTVLACLPAGQQQPGSFAWEHYDNSVSYWGHGAPHPDRMLEQWLGVKLKDLDLPGYVFAAGLVQGEGLHEYIRNFRRRMFDSAAAVFWMYNDCWPMVRSWTIVDYFLRRTPAFHPVRRAFQPLSVFLAAEDGKVRVFGVNEGPVWSGRLEYGVFALAGRYPMARETKVELPANASVCLAEFPEAAWRKAGFATHGAFAVLTDADGNTAAQDRLFMPLFKEMKWPAARVRVRLNRGKAVFSCDTFAWRVCLDLDGEKAWPDNFFDILPGRPVKLPWPDSLGKPRVLRVGNTLFPARRTARRH